MWFFLAVCALHNGLGGSVVVDGEMYFVLHLGEKIASGRSVLFVIHAGGIDIGNLLVKSPLAKPDLTDLFQ